MRRGWMCAGLITLGVACHFTLDRTLAPGEIEGRLVVTSLTGQESPVANARVALDYSVLSVESDTNGHFVLAGLPSGTFAITIETVQSGGSGLVLQSLLVQPADALDLGTLVVGRYGRITGTVTLGGVAADAATVVLTGLTQTAVSDGGFAFEELAPGNYTVGAIDTKDGEQTTSAGPVNVEVKPGETTQVMLMLGPASAGSIAGVVQVGGSAAPESVSITLSSPGVTGLTSTHPSADGTYEYPSLPPGIYTVTTNVSQYDSIMVPSLVVSAVTAQVPAITLLQIDGGPEDAGVADGGVADGGSSGGTSDGGVPVGFQPSNLDLATMGSLVGQAMDEQINGSCSVSTDSVSPGGDCFQSPITVVTQSGGTTINLVVVSSLTVGAAGTITTQGSYPLVVVSLAGVTISGTIQVESDGELSPVSDDTTGLGAGGGAGANDAGSPTAVGGSGGSYCGLGGEGGGQTVEGSAVGSPDIRPLVGGSSGGSGAEASGAGGGAIQIVAAGDLTVMATGVITAGGGGGNFAGLAGGQNSAGGGSGGSILLEAQTVTISGILAANGGGGGGTYGGGSGDDATANAVPAPGGGADSSDAGGGGVGGAGTMVNGGPGGTGPDSSSGGGGGGCGRIRINTVAGTAMITGTISPATTTACAVVAQTRTTSEGP